MAEEPPARRRIIGTALRRYRENLGYALEDAARILDCDRSKISRIETGQRGIRPKELRELLTEYGVPETEQHALAGLARRSGHGGWWDDYTDIAPDSALDYLIMESAAAEIMIYDPLLVPDLFQVPVYARAVAAARPGTWTGSQLDAATAALAARQQSVLGGSTQLRVVIGEAALRQEIGEPGVMGEQIRALTELASEHPCVTLQVVPFAAGAHAGMPGGGHVIVRSAPNIGAVYLPAITGGAYFTSDADLALYVRAFTLLRSTALSGTDTMRLLREVRDNQPPWQ